MATYAENLVTIRDNLVAQLVTDSANPQPSYVCDGQEVDWMGYYKFMSEQIDRLNLQIATADPIEIVSQGFSP